MKKALAIVTVSFIVLPALSNALVVETRASSHTGGVTAGPGERVVTGQNQSSVQINTVMTGNTARSTSTVEITKIENGVQESERRVYVAPRGGVQVQVEAGTGRKSKTDVKVQDTTPRQRAVEHAAAPNTIDVQPILSVFTLPAQKKTSLSWLSLLPGPVRSFISRLFAAL